MSLEVVKSVMEGLEPKTKRELNPRLAPFGRNPEKAAALLAALDANQRLEGFSEAQWRVLHGAYYAHLEAVTTTTSPTPEVTVQTDWVATLPKLAGQLQFLPGDLGSRFAATLITMSSSIGHAEVGAGLEAIAFGRGRAPKDLQKALGSGAPAEAVLAVVRNHLKGIVPLARS